MVRLAILTDRWVYAAALVLVLAGYLLARGRAR